MNDSIRLWPFLQDAFAVVVLFVLMGAFMALDTPAIDAWLLQVVTPSAPFSP